MAITLISTPPAVITREQARQLQNTEDAIIGPIARHTQHNVRVQFTPPAADAMLGKGTLWVAESKLYFYSWNTNTGLAIDYPTIIIHAVSRQQALDGTGPCIYTQLDEKLNIPNRTSTQQQTSATSASQEEEEEEDHATELKFIPDDIGALDAIFEALSECAALHPDKEFMEEEEDPDDEFYYGNGNGDGNDDNQWFMAAPSDEQEELSEIGRASLAYLESIIDRPTNTNITTQQSPPSHQHCDYDEEMFQDAEEDEK